MFGSNLMLWKITDLKFKTPPEEERGEGGGDAVNDGRKSSGAFSRLIGCLPQVLPDKESNRGEREEEEARAMFGMEGWMQGRTEEVEGW